MLCIHVPYIILHLDLSITLTNYLDHLRINKDNQLIKHKIKHNRYLVLLFRNKIIKIQFSVTTKGLMNY